MRPIRTSSSSLTRSRRGPQRHPRMSTWRGSSPKVSRRGVVVSTKLVEPSVPGAAWTTSPATVRETTECHVDVAPQSLMGRSIFGELVTWPKSELRRRMIDSDTGLRPVRVVTSVYQQYQALGLPSGGRFMSVFGYLPGLQHFSSSSHNPCSRCRLAFVGSCRWCTDVGLSQAELWPRVNGDTSFQWECQKFDSLRAENA